MSLPLAFALICFAIAAAILIGLFAVDRARRRLGRGQHAEQRDTR